MNYPNNNCVCPNVNNYAYIRGPRENCEKACKALVTGGVAYNAGRCVAACGGVPWCGALCAMLSSVAGMYGCEYVCDQLMKKPEAQLWPWPGGHDPWAKKGWV